MLRHSFALAVALALAGTVAGGCAVEDSDEDIASDELALATGDVAPSATAFTLTITQNAGVGDVTVSWTPDFHDICRNDCQEAILSGSRVTLHALTNRVDCFKFLKWDGACAGQGSTCEFTMTSDKSTMVTWTRLLGCDPG